MLCYNNATIISLGYSCETITLLLKQISTGKATKITHSVFDRMATPMWAVSQLVANNFAGLLNNVESMSIFQNYPEKWLVDKQYYIRLFPKTTDSPQYAKYKEAILAKAQNFGAMLTAAAAAQTPVLFVRTQEPTCYADYGARIIYPEYQTQYQQSEYDYLKEFSKTISTMYPTLQFNILFLSDIGVCADAEHNIVGICKPCGDYRHPQIATLMEHNIAAHEDHLVSCMSERLVSRIPNNPEKNVALQKTSAAKPVVAAPKPKAPVTKIRVVEGYYHTFHY